MKTIQIDNGMSIIDSRDVISYIEELTEEREVLESALANAEDTLTDAQDDTSALDKSEIEDLKDAVRCAEEALADWDDSDSGTHLTALRLLDSEGRDASSDWLNGVSLIRDEYFEEYAQQFAEDIGEVNSRNDTWPLNCIDWKLAAEQLQQDYTSINFDNQIYWISSN